MTSWFASFSTGSPCPPVPSPPTARSICLLMQEPLGHLSGRAGGVRKRPKRGYRFDADVVNSRQESLLQAHKPMALFYLNVSHSIQQELRTEISRFHGLTPDIASTDFIDSINSLTRPFSASSSGKVFYDHRTPSTLLNFLRSFL